ncbi:DUF6929 family protein [Sphingobacterium psychroaquaticum]|uniref:Uncharacterized protein n=1 Tax=Sphingobacterium psychroaquaticum TaxID=561061 RepID=A0A1X7L0N5_9SPHI|nr:hypothetical protein [Sphingobacterium psychroaquaticum]SMG47398.1 hypothetical protein SAMN05660862_3413 [Sphingobacterium psychroaquaticum]
MKDLILEILLTIKGIGAASGLLYTNNTVHIISDNSNYLYSYTLTDHALQKRPLLEAPVMENIAKKDKADFEAISQKENRFYIFGSGSTLKRTSLATTDLSSEKAIVLNVTPLYQQLQKDFQVEQADFNIEGALPYAGSWWLFNRGNGPQQQNGVFIVNTDFTEGTAFYPITLPKINNVATGFTDAILHEGLIYFMAAAEDVASNYLDGEVKGTLVGCLDPQDKSVVWTKTISNHHKFEGLTYYESTPNHISFLLCEDSDDDTGETKVYKLSIQR